MVCSVWRTAFPGTSHFADTKECDAKFAQASPGPDVREALEAETPLPALDRSPAAFRTDLKIDSSEAWNQNGSTRRLELRAVASITIKNIPDQLLARLREQAAAENRSMNREIIRLLDTSLSADRGLRLEFRRTLADIQADAWSRLGGNWISDVTIEEEIADIYSARSGGREIAS